MEKIWKTVFKCAVCGKETAGRMPNDKGFQGDTSFRFPRRHKVNGKNCEGNIQEAIWIDKRLNEIKP